MWHQFPFRLRGPGDRITGHVLGALARLVECRALRPGESPEMHDVLWALAEFLRPAEAIGLLERRDGSSRMSREPLVLNDAGRAALIAALRARAIAPAKVLR
jgi:hypothetical protein